MTNDPEDILGHEESTDILGHEESTDILGHEESTDELGEEESTDELGPEAGGTDVLRPQLQTSVGRFPHRPGPSACHQTPRIPLPSVPWLRGPRGVPPAAVQGGNAVCRTPNPESGPGRCEPEVRTSARACPGHRPPPGGGAPRRRSRRESARRCAASARPWRPGRRVRPRGCPRAGGCRRGPGGS